MRRRNNGGGAFLLIFLIFFFFGNFGSVLMPIIMALIMGGLFYGVYKSVKSSQTNAYTNSDATARKKTRRYGMTDTSHTADEKARVNAYLRKQFKSGKQEVSFESGSRTITLVCDGKYSNIYALQVECDGHVFDTAAKFRKKFPDEYNQMFETLLTMARNDSERGDGEIIDVEFSRKSDETVKSEPKKEKTKTKPENAEDFREIINGLNDDIPDEEISNALYETSALLKQLSDLEKTFPEQKTKLKKLYTNYLPYLIGILEQYAKIQYVETDANFEENEKSLKDTIGHINAAMKDRLIPEMSENDSINLSADLSTLEAMLKKDGMMEEQDIMAQLRKEERAAKQGAENE